MRRAGMLTLGMMLMATPSTAVSLDALTPPARAALEPAISGVIERFNADEETLSRAPRVIVTGPAEDPSMLRATYRQAGSEHDVIAAQAGATPTVTVRFRATELEKRVTNVNGGNLHEALAKAAWKKSPRGYLIDVRLRWDGEAWKSEGTPAEHPTLGVVGRPEVDRILERGPGLGPQ
jgi:hypothetical protein